MDESISQLLDRCRRQEPEAVEQLVLQVRPWAEGVALAFVHDHDLAEDVVQEALLTALSKLHQLREDGAFIRWFRQIIRSHACRILRERKTEFAEEDEVATRSDQGPDIRDMLATEELVALVRKAMKSLPPKNQQAVELFYFDDMSCKQVSELLNIPAGTVKRQLHDSRCLLRAMLLGQVESPKPVKKRKGFPL